MTDTSEASIAPAGLEQQLATAAAEAPANYSAARIANLEHELKEAIEARTAIEQALGEIRTRYEQQLARATVTNEDYIGLKEAYEELRQSFNKIYLIIESINTDAQILRTVVVDAWLEGADIDPSEVRIPLRRIQSASEVFVDRHQGGYSPLEDEDAENDDDVESVIMPGGGRVVEGRVTLTMNSGLRRIPRTDEEAPTP